MLKIYPLQLAVPPADRAADVACPPYDVISTAEAAEIAGRSADSFVKIIRPEILLDDSAADQAYALARRHWQAALDSAILPVQSPAIYLYQQLLGDHVQTGIVCGYDVQQYRDGLIRKHELTRPDKEDDRVQHMLACEAHPEPVLLAFRSVSSITALMQADMQSEPVFDFIADDGVRHIGWKASSAKSYIAAFEQIPAAYIADGHHRTAAAERVATQLSDQGNAGEANRVLAVMFPIEQLQILAYNRVVKPQPGSSPENVLSEIKQRFQVTEASSAEPTGAGEVCFYLSGQWYSFRFEPVGKEDFRLADTLDVARLQREILQPVFGIDDPRTHPDIDFVGGIRGTAELERRVDSGAAVVAFSMFPTSMEQLVQISDLGAVMPPKSTWFEPKLRSGLFVHPF